MKARLTPAIAISIADARLSRAMRRAIDAAVRAAADAVPDEDLPIVRLRTHKRLALLGPSKLAGALAMVRVTERNARRVPALVEGIRAAGVLGVQLVWNGSDPPLSLVERHVFHVLERARATPAGPPVVLAASSEPTPALRILVASRRKDGTRS